MKLNLLFSKLRLLFVFTILSLFVFFLRIKKVYVWEYPFEGPYMEVYVIYHVHCTLSFHLVCVHDASSVSCAVVIPDDLSPVMLGKTWGCIGKIRFFTGTYATH